MSSLDVARRLDRLRLLSGGARGAHPRQQSVTATIDWSYRLLAENEQDLLRPVVGVRRRFRPRSGARRVRRGRVSEDDTLDLLTGLVDKSMVILRGGTNRTRYGILETLRTYGRDRLRDRGLHDELADRHARYFTVLLEQANAGMRGADEQAWVERLMPGAGKNYTAPDYDNIRTAFEYAFASDMDLALRLVLPLPELMNRIGYHSAVWADRAVELAAPDHPLYAAAVGVAARAAWVNGQFPHARSLAQLAAGRVPPPGTPYLAYPDEVLADLDLYEGNAAAALAFYEAQLAGVGDGTEPDPACADRGQDRQLPPGVGHAGRCTGVAEGAVEIADATANPTTRSLARCTLGRVLAQSNPDRALRLLDEAFELGASVENNWIIGTAWMESAAILRRTATRRSPRGLSLSWSICGRKVVPVGHSPAMGHPAIRESVPAPRRRPCTKPWRCIAASWPPIWIRRSPPLRWRNSAASSMTRERARTPSSSRGSRCVDAADLVISRLSKVCATVAKQPGDCSDQIRRPT